LKSARDLPRRPTHRVNRLSLLRVLFGDPGDCPCATCRLGASTSKDAAVLEELLRGWDGMDPSALQQIEVHGAAALQDELLPRFCLFFKERDVELVFHCSSLEQGSLPTLSGCFERIVVHLAGSASVHDRIRRSPGSAARLADAIAELKTWNCHIEVSGLIILERTNCDNLAEAVEFSRSIGLDHLAFGHAELEYERDDRPTRLSDFDLPRLSRSIESLLGSFGPDFCSGFIATKPARLWEIFKYFKGFSGAGRPSPPHCRIPWFSCAIRKDGAVFACPRHRVVGDLGTGRLHRIVNGPSAVGFRRNLDVSRDGVCAGCIDYRTGLT
jgi:hypothetical protein